MVVWWIHGPLLSHLSRANLWFYILLWAFLLCDWLTFTFCFSPTTTSTPTSVESEILYSSPTPSYDYKFVPFLTWHCGSYSLVYQCTLKALKTCAFIWKIPIYLHNVRFRLQLCVSTFLSEFLLSLGWLYNYIPWSLLSSYSLKSPKPWQQILIITSNSNHEIPFLLPILKLL